MARDQYSERNARRECRVWSLDAEAVCYRCGAITFEVKFPRKARERSCFCEDFRLARKSRIFGFSRQFLKEHLIGDYSVSTERYVRVDSRRIVDYSALGIGVTFRWLDTVTHIRAADFAQSAQFLSTFPLLWWIWRLQKWPRGANGAINWTAFWQLLCMLICDLAVQFGRFGEGDVFRANPHAKLTKTEDSILYQKCRCFIAAASRENVRGTRKILLFHQSIPNSESHSYPPVTGGHQISPRHQRPVAS